MDKTFWQSIVANDCALPVGYRAADLLPGLLDLLTSPDPELRDDVAYLVFARWIVRDRLFDTGELRALVATLTQNLTLGIGERNTDSVLRRSFSALVLSLIAYHDIQTPFADSNEIADLLDVALRYLNAEQDLRGYVAGKGWYHATAHTADLLKFLCRNPKTNAEQHQRVLDAIFERLSAPAEYVYVHDEDERLTLAVFDILRRESLGLDVWQGWFGRFVEWKQAHIGPGAFGVSIHAPYMNCKNFLRSLYFTVQAAHEQQLEGPASALMPELLKLVHVYGAGTIYTG